MRRPLVTMLTLFFGVVLGLLTAKAALDGELGFSRLTYGPWVGNPRLGGVNADPYTKARLIRSGELPLGGGEGITFIAEQTSDGQSLSTACTYAIEGEMAAARYWTLTATTREGAPFQNPSRRYGFTSSEILREPGGSVRIALSALPQAGNWLPLSGAAPLRLTLRLYDTPLANEAAGVEPAWPAIRRLSCP